MALRHDPTKHVVTFVPNVLVGGSPFTVLGHDMTDWCTVSDDNDRMTLSTSGDGIQTFEKNPNKSASITLKLMQNSPTRTAINSMVKAHELLDIEIGQIIYTNGNTREIDTLTGCELSKMPDKSASDKNGTVEYKFLATSKETLDIDGNILTNVSNVITNTINSIL